MATAISQPLQLSSALRCVEFGFEMPSAGVAPEEKKLIYRLFNTTDGEYLTAWKEYPTVSDGQEIKIDFVEDLRRILTTPKPNITATVPYTDTSIIKTIEVEYGERTVNNETCEVTDVVNGLTSPIDVVNGIRRHQQLATQTDILNNRGVVLHDRAKRYSISKDGADFLYVVGSKRIRLSYYTSANVFISAVDHIINQPFPNSVCTIIPIGFDIAPATAGIIHVSASDTGTPNLTTNLLFTLENNFYSVENGSHNLLDKTQRAPSDFYFQNNFGGFDMLSFEVINSIAANVAKQEIIHRFDCATEYTGYATDQRTNINNNSFTSITYQRSWGRPLTYHDQKWLAELASSNNVWVKEYLDFGTSSLQAVLLKFQLTNSEVVTRGGDFIISGYYSEVALFPN